MSQQLTKNVNHIGEHKFPYEGSIPNSSEPVITDGAIELSIHGIEEVYESKDVIPDDIKFEEEVDDIPEIVTVYESKDVLQEEDVTINNNTDENNKLNMNKLGGIDMLKVGVIGVGNAGNQVASLSKELLGMQAVAINCSEKDLETLPDTIDKLLIGDAKGAGKVRKDAKLFLKDKIMNLLNSDIILSMMENDVIFVVSSTGGGTGSGIAPVFADILRKTFPDTQVILIGILPTLREVLSTQANTLEYLEELYSSDVQPTYMLYDNEKYAKQPTHTMMTSINESIVRDLEVLSGKFQTTTKFTSIDEKDMSKITGTPGRMVVFGVRDLKESLLDDKTVDELLVDAAKTTTHVGFQRDLKVHRIGVITNCNERIMQTIDNDMPAVKAYIGTPIEEFEHVVVNEDSRAANNVFVVASGLSKINERIRRIKDRVEEIQSEQARFDEAEDELAGYNVKALNSQREEKEVNTKDVDINDLFSQYGL